jgi:hypothetical protein
VAAAELTHPPYPIPSRTQKQIIVVAPELTHPPSPHPYADTGLTHRPCPTPTPTQKQFIVAAAELCLRDYQAEGIACAALAACPDNAAQVRGQQTGKVSPVCMPTSQTTKRQYHRP